MLLKTDNLSKSFGARTLFRGISLSLIDGQIVGLIGPNGSGKSTLLRILADLEHADSGSIELRRNTRVDYLAQEDIFPASATVEEVMLDAFAENDPRDHHEREVEAAIQLGKVGFTDFTQKAESLSGGWRKRLALARELVKKPGLLLLDEPTNHLDLEGILWLEKLLTESRFACLLVSHDRYFLEEIADRIIELNSAYPDGYLSHEGSYSDFLEKREEFLAAQAAREQSLASQVRREIEWLQRGAKARRTKAKGRIQQAHEMMSDLADLRTRNTAGAGSGAGIDFSASGRQTRKMIAARNVAKSMGGRRLFTGVGFTLGPGTRLGLLGPNGSGKSTLLRIIKGDLAPDEGVIERADELRIVSFEQNRASLDRTLTLRKALAPHNDKLFFRGQELHVSGWAKRFLFRTEQLDTSLGELSGGEQSRVLIARMMIEPADVLLLDEPTNDLDIGTLEVIEESLADFAGAIVLVTHDRYLLDRLATDLLALDGKGGANIYADLSQWEAAQERAEEKKAGPAVSTRTEKKVPPGLKRLTYMEQREWEQIEGRIMDAEAELEAARKEMDDPAVLANRDRLHAACARVDSAQKLVEGLYARWEELQEKQTRE